MEYYKKADNYKNYGYHYIYYDGEYVPPVEWSLSRLNNTINLYKNVMKGNATNIYFYDYLLSIKSERIRDIKKLINKF